MAKSTRSKSTVATVQSPKWQSQTLLGPKSQIVLSVVIGLHLLAVLAEPLRFFSRSSVLPAAAETDLLRSWLGPYVDFMYLDHGYFFFAPNPGPNHLIECRIEKESRIAEAEIANKEPVQDDAILLTFPSRKLHWPRLLYHRYFMFTEFYSGEFFNTVLVPSESPSESRSDRQPFVLWQPERQRYLMIQRSLTKHWNSKYPECDIQLKRIEHLLPTEYQVLVENWKLDDPRLYMTLPESTPSLAGRDSPESISTSDESISPQVSPTKANSAP